MKTLKYISFLFFVFSIAYINYPKNTNAYNNQSELNPQINGMYISATVESASKYCLDNDLYYNSFVSYAEGTQNLNNFNSITQEWEIISSQDYIGAIKCSDFKKDYQETSMIHTFSELKYDELTYTDDIVILTGTGETISYTKQNQDIIKLSYQQLYILIFIAFISVINCFYPIINDILGKR